MYYVVKTYNVSYALEVYQIPGQAYKICIVDSLADGDEVIWGPYSDFEEANIIAEMEAEQRGKE